MTARQLLRTGTAVAGFFAFKLTAGLVLLATSARWLSVPEFGVYSQLFLLLALLTTVSAAGAQNGIIREVAARRATPDDGAGGVVRGALILWTAISAVAIVGSFVTARPVARLLTDGEGAAWSIPLLTGVAMLGGLGIVMCAVLTGRGRAPLALGLQALGLALGTGLCLVLLSRGMAVAAVLGFAAGPLVTTLGGVAYVSDWRVGWSREDVRGARRLLSFSASFLIVAALMPVTLFVLRDHYRDAFGAVALGYWLAANRISDVTSQLLGLFMGQAFLPGYAAATTAAARRQLAWRTFWIATALFAAGLALFTVAAPTWVRLILSAQFLPAIPFIIAYLAGDVLRVATSLAQHAALAERRLRSYVLIEAAAAGALTVPMIGLIATGVVAAPIYAYPIGCLTITVLIAAFWYSGKTRR